MSLITMKKRYIYIIFFEFLMIGTFVFKYLELHKRSGNRDIGMEAEHINAVVFLN